MRKIFALLISLCFASPALAADNYTATAGSGLTFAAKDNGSGVLFSRFIGCDNTTTTQCWAVDASGRLTVNLAAGGTVAATQSGPWTVQPGNTANTTPWLTSISQGGNTAAVKAANTVATTDVGVVVAVANTLTPGQATMANSSPVVLPSDQSPLPVANFTPNGNYATLTATAASSASTALPAGIVVAFQNTSNVDVSCVLSAGAATATTNKLILHGGSTLYVQVGSNINAACINQIGTDSNVIAMAGGTGHGNSFGSFDTQNLTATVSQGAAGASPWLVRPNDGTRSAIIDPCEANLQSYAPISITTATTTRIVAPSASNKTYICGLVLVTAAANNVGVVEGTGGTCGTGTAGVIGGTTAANGPNFSANGGIALQAGKVAQAQTAGTNVDLCLITSAATPLAGGIKYVQAP